MAYKIDADECTGCSACEPVCPVACISDRGDSKRVIDENECTSCGLCAQECPVDCISEG